jgi:anaerobic C4-dicarboxylate transporter DcuB
MRRLLTIGIACALLGIAGFTAVSTFSPHSSGAATTTATTTGATGATGATGTTGAQGTVPATPTPEPAATETSTSDWILIAIEGLLVIGFIALGVRSGGIGLGLWGGVGTLILVFVFGLDPGEPPFDAMLIIVAVIAAAAAMEAAGGIDYMVLIASRALRARPKAINFVAPYVSYLLCILTGTSNTFYSIIPVINEVSFANKIRPERPLAGSTVASALGITSSPVAAAMATILPLVEVYDYNLVDVLLITIPASLVGIFLMSLVMSRHGRDLEDDAEYKRRRDAGEIQAPASSENIRLKQYAKRSVAIFLGAVLVICIFGLFEGIRPTVAAAEGPGTEPLAVTPIIQMVMLTAAAMILVFAHVSAADIPGMPIFRSGMVAMIALFGIAWMADTFIASNEDAIVSALGDLAGKWPFMIAVAIFAVAALTTSQSAATRTMVPLGLALGIGAGYMIAMWTAVAGVLFLPANGTQIAAAEADSTGTTTLGKRVIDHSFQLPLQVAWITTALVGILIVAVFH